jgi:hypothetical protein
MKGLTIPWRCLKIRKIQQSERDPLEAMVRYVFSRQFDFVIDIWRRPGGGWHDSCLVLPAARNMETGAPVSALSGQPLVLQ